MALQTKSSSLSSPAAKPSAAAAILDIAQALVQSRGYNGFSYADIAEQMGMTKASLHYHFPSKAELGTALIERYQIAFQEALATIDEQSAGSFDKLRRYIDLYHAVLKNERMCLCGMLAAEVATLPAPMQDALRRFFDENERWLTTMIEAGVRAGEFRFGDSPSLRAQSIVAALEGAMLVSRSYGDIKRFQSVAASILSDVVQDARQ